MPKIIECIILVMVLIGECVVLWRVRKRKYWKILAWAHAFLLLLALAVLPFWALAEIQPMYLVRPHIPLYWILMGLAYLCFIIVLFQVWFRQPAFVPTDSDNILDDYAE
jgi:predicted lysophospholipase L1 biosynthesis ABC-type transport system permease subunit